MEILSPRNKTLIICSLNYYKRDLETLSSKNVYKCKPSKEQLLTCIHDHELDSIIEDIKWLIALLEELK